MSKFLDLTGQTFDKLTVIERSKDYISPNGQHKTTWLCRCECGNEVSVETQRLRKNKCNCCPDCRDTKHGGKAKLLNKRFGRLLVVEEVRIKKNKVHWRCICDCGNETLIETSRLTSGKTMSCGCLARELTSKRCAKDWTGQKFNHLTVVKRVSPIGEQVKWECVCDCGNVCVVSAQDLRRQKSCGCLKYKGTHNMTNTRLHRIWIKMKQRCSNPNEKAFRNYGGRGIKVCEEWVNDFVAFYDWAINNGYNDKLEIDRVNNDKDYSPDNCRWITHQEQQYNKRSNRLVEYNGETKPLKKWTEELNLDYHRVNTRLLNGWSIEDAFWGDGKTHFKKYYNVPHAKKPVVQYDLQMNKIREYSSVREAAREIKGARGGISDCCHYKRSEYKGFVWRYSDEIQNEEAS